MVKESNTPLSRRATAEAAVIEIRDDATHVLRIQSIGQATVVEDCWTCQSLIAPNGPKPGPTIRRIRERLGRDIGITLVINSSDVFCLVQKAPVSTEQAIRSHVQQATLQQQKIDLSKSFWSVMPLGCGFDDQRSLTEALSNKLNVLVSAAPKNTIQNLHAAFAKEECVVRQTLFPLHCLTKAFEQVSGTAFESQTIALLHVRQDSYGLAFSKRGTVIAYIENKMGDFSDVAEQIREQIQAVQSKYKTQVRCVFVSSNNGDDQKLADEIKAAGSYARTWNACKRLSFASSAGAHGKFVESTRFNVLAGAVTLAIDAARMPQDEPETEPAEIVESPSQVTLLVRPFAIAICILLCPLGLFIYENTRLQAQVRTARAAYTSEQKQAEMKKNTAGDVHQRMADLELFAKSRHPWPQIITELRSVSVPGVELLQLKATDTLSGVEANPFQPVSTSQAGRNQGSLVLEARNQAGLVALEKFMDSVKNASQIRSLLNRKRPARLINNFVLGSSPDQDHETTLFTVEYAFEERWYK